MANPIKVTEYRKINGSLTPVYPATVASNVTVEGWNSSSPTDALLSTVLSDLRTSIANIGGLDVLVPKGAVPSTGLPASHTVGWTYWVTSDFAGEDVGGVTTEVGDMVLCISTGSTANDADWIVLQTNLDPTEFVKGPSSSVTTDTVALFNGTTGKVIKSSGYTLGKSVPSDAVFTDVKVTQTATSTSTDYRLVFTYTGGSSVSGNKTEGIRYDASAKYNPSTHTLSGVTVDGYTKTADLPAAQDWVEYGTSVPSDSSSTVTNLPDGGLFILIPGS